MVNSEELGSGGDFGSCANETAFFQLGISSETAPDILESIRTESNNSQVLLEMVAQEGEREKVPARAAKR